MKQNLVLQWKLLFRRKEFYLSFAIMLGLAVAAFVTDCREYYGWDLSECHSASMLFYLRTYNASFSGIVMSLYPLLAVLPFADSYIVDRHNAVLPVLLAKGKFRDYYFSKMLVTFLASFLVLFVPQAVNMALNAVAFPWTVPGDFTNVLYGWTYAGTIESFAFPRLLNDHPGLYNLLFALTLSVTGGLMAAVSYCLSYILNKSRVLIICLMFLLLNVITLICQALRLSTDAHITSYLFPCAPLDYHNFWIFAGYIAAFLLIGAACTFYNLLHHKKRVV